MEKLFESAQSVWFFLIFFVPGFVSLKIYDSLVASDRRDFSRSMLDAIAYSALNYGAVGPGALWLWQNSTLVGQWLTGVIALVVFPVLWPFLWIKLLSTGAFAKHFIHPTQRPWDFVFGQRKPYWMIVHLRDQRRVGGLFDSASFASSHPAEPQIYIEKVWELDEKGIFVRPVERSEGLIILGQEIAAVELFGYSKEGESE